MKVKVSYTVDMKEVPEEVRLILSKAESKVGKVRRAITKLTDVESSILEGEVQQAISDIEALREDLFSADILLSDSESILRGYLTEMISPPQSQPQEEQNDKTEN
jgi:uncharacterized protein YjbJ (UPF0337 family)